MSNKGDLRLKLEQHGFMAAGLVAGAMPMPPRLQIAWTLYEESNGNMFMNFPEKGPANSFSAPKILSKQPNYAT